MRHVVNPSDAFVLFDQLDAIPHFNPDLDTEAVPQPVGIWRSSVREADALILSTPEYAHSLPGTFKNAFDWLVSSGELFKKPVALLHASARGTYAREHLLEVLRAMDALPDPPELTIPLTGKIADPASIARENEAALRQLIARLR